MPRQLAISLLTLLSFYARHPLQALFLTIGLTTGVGLWSAVQLINDHARASYAEADQLLGAEAKYWIRARSGKGVSPDDYIVLRRLGFRAIYPILEVRRRTEAGEFVNLIATDILALGDPSNSSQATNPFAAESWLTFIQPEYRSWYPKDVARQLGIRQGDQLLLSDGARLPPAEFQSRDQQGQRIFMDIGAAMDILDLSNFSYLGVGEHSVRKIEQLKNSLPDHLVLVKNEQSLDLFQLTQSLHTNLTALGFLSFIVGIFIVFNAVRFSLSSRHSTIATLRELGVGIEVLSAAIILEGLLWSLMGSVVGLWLGYWLGESLLPAVAVSLQGLYGANLSNQMEFGLQLLPQAFALTLGGMFLALIMPLLDTAKRAVKSVRDQVVEPVVLVTGAKLSALVGVACLSLALLGYHLVTSVEAGFVVIGLAMLGGVLLLPSAIVSLTEVVVRRVPDSSLLVRWSIRDALVQLPHLRIALMALMLTLIANIGVTLLVDSFRSALTDWLDARLSANVYVLGEPIEGLSEQEWVIESHTRYRQELRVTIGAYDRPASVFGIDPTASDFSSMKLLKAEPNGFERWSTPSGLAPVPIIANEQLHYLGGVQPGQVVLLGTKKFEVVGFIHDYGNPHFSFWLPEVVARQQFNSLEPLGIGLWIEPGEMDYVREQLQSLGLKPGDWLEQDRIRTITFQIFDRTFAITRALNTVTLLVTGLALLAALLAVHQSRVVDYGHWRSLGLRWSEWGLILGMPLMLMVICTFLLAIPLGYILSWLLIHQLNVLAFGWTMELQWSWLPVVTLLLMSVGMVITTLLMALIKTRRELSGSIRRLSGGNG